MVPATAIWSLTERQHGLVGRRQLNELGIDGVVLRPLIRAGAWNRSDAFRTVQRLARKAGVEGRISLHSLRHTCATIALDNGVALHDLQDSLGPLPPTFRRLRRAGNVRGRPSNC